MGAPPRIRSVGHALPKATQNLLAADGRITIAPHIDIDVATTGPASTIRVNVNSGTSILPLSPPLTIDVYNYVTTLLRCCDFAPSPRAPFSPERTLCRGPRTLLCLGD